MDSGFITLDQYALKFQKYFTWKRTWSRLFVSKCIKQNNDLWSITESLFTALNKFLHIEQKHIQDPCQTSMMELFYWKQLTTFSSQLFLQKSSTIDVWKDPKCTSAQLLFQVLMRLNYFFDQCNIRNRKISGKFVLKYIVIHIAKGNTQVI